MSDMTTSLLVTATRAMDSIMNDKPVWQEFDDPALQRALIRRCPDFANQYDYLTLAKIATILIPHSQVTFKRGNVHLASYNLSTGKLNFIIDFDFFSANQIGAIFMTAYAGYWYS
jgi:hypothetical protein